MSAQNQPNQDGDEEVWMPQWADAAPSDAPKKPRDLTASELKLPVPVSKASDNDESVVIRIITYFIMSTFPRCVNRV